MLKRGSESSTASPAPESSASAGWTPFTRSQRLMSQMLSSLIPNSAEDIFRKYPALLDVPFISMSEILITREIGSGSFGRVFHGIFSFQDVAVKQLTVRNFRDDIDIYDMADSEAEDVDKKARQAAETLLALEKEVGMLKRITFPKVVGFYGVCFEPAAIVTEYCARGSLFDLIARARVLPRVALEMSWEKRLHLANDAAIGMHFLHNRNDPVIHRDLKSPNLLVDDHYNCKVADFNTAGFVNATEVTKSRANNPRWIAPEILDAKPYTKASDVYPFGIILWELMTWKPPFEDMTTYNILISIVRDSLRPDDIPNDQLLGGPCPVYDEYVALMKECWDQDPEKRPEFSEICKRLGQMIKTVGKMEKEQEPPARVQRILKESTRSPRETSPEPRNITRTPRSVSPFSQSPEPTQSTIPGPANSAEVTQVQMSMSVPGSELQDEEECMISPFQNGPPSMTTSNQSKAGAELKTETSFANWSTRVTSPNTVATSCLVDYSDVVQSSAEHEEESRPGKRLWKKISKEFGLDDLVVAESKPSRRAIERWDSVRTAIFGDPTTETFQEQFGSFLKGDETTVLKQRLKEIENKGSPGLRILRALMDLREKRETEEDRQADGTEDEKPSGWCLVKHLMMLNLPRPVHSMWELIADNVKPRQSGSGTLGTISEDHQASTGNGAQSARPSAKTVHGRALWQKVREAFLDKDFQRTKPVMHPRWKQLRDVLFSDEDESDRSGSLSPSPSIASAPATEAVPKKPSKWGAVRKGFGIGVVERNWDFLTQYARSITQNPDRDRSKSVPETARARAAIRKLAIVDNEPPDSEKWRVVREILLEEDMGVDWKSLIEKARNNISPPRGTEWEIFRWLFFENKRLRDQPKWTFIKDLFLKTDTGADQDP